MSHLKNVLRLVGCCLEFEEPVMVYEYVEAITLSDLLFREEFTAPIIHRDIKLHKVMIDQNSGVAKIIDFSLSISLPPGELELLTGKESLYSTQSNIEEGNVMDGVDSRIYEETTNFKDPNPPTMIELYIKESNAIDIADPTFLEQHGIEIRQQLEDYLDLVKKCTTVQRRKQAIYDSCC
ncbi:hypothetical protein RDI58_015577 [Solanum bulbocastanum]|uniref:Protein kinase domain-containing protein n=1 Tax=Solanum bulbocastanum TaxID=147425 RepID=A0AAN8TKS3_SOLBU